MYCTYFAKLYETFASGKVWFRHWWIQFYLFTGFVKVYQSHFRSALSENTSKITYFGKDLCLDFLLEFMFSLEHVGFQQQFFFSVIITLIINFISFSLGPNINGQILTTTQESSSLILVNVAIQSNFTQFGLLSG